MSTGIGYALARAEQIHALTAYQGITTADGAVGGNTLIDANLIGKNDFITGKNIIIMTGDAAYEDMGASAFNSGTGQITIQGTGFSARIKAGISYRVLNISSVDTKIGTNADAAGTDTLFARLASLAAQTNYAEASASGTTSDAYADALDLDTRGMKSLTAVVENTHGANSLTYRPRARMANFASGDDEEIPECPGEEVLAAGEKGLVTLIKGYSRVKIQVKSTTPATPADYTIDYLINR